MPYSRLGKRPFLDITIFEGQLEGHLAKTGVPRKSKYRDFAACARRSRASPGRDTKRDIYPPRRSRRGDMSLVGPVRGRRATTRPACVSLGCWCRVVTTHQPAVGENPQPELTNREMKMETAIIRNYLDSNPALLDGAISLLASVPENKPGNEITRNVFIAGIYNSVIKDKSVAVLREAQLVVADED